ncbi:Myotubularin-related 3 [Lecanosticta acicola]|uniref:Myotubularin-related 3 n=1 Tax=Lecanosticta acicola TaxID=111012 RepID=A0AAI8Z6V9_9PEZI|nr:Myotubularin-related 3 [Lecanosticta acicola]
MRELKVPNVRLYNRGQTENGTLHLTRHHLIFVYHPGAKLRAGTGASTPTRTGASFDGASAQRASADSRTTDPHITSKAKLKAKEIWVPYPMINYCLLRPSNSHGRQTEHHLPLERDDPGMEDTQFPPLFGTNSYRPSSESAHLAPHSSPQRSISPDSGIGAATPGDGFRPAAIRLRKRDFQMMAFHFFPSPTEPAPDKAAREVFYCLRSHCCVDRVQDLYAFHFKAPQQEVAAATAPYDARREFARMGIGEKAAEGPGSAWRVTDINTQYQYAPTYPSTLCVPRVVSDNTLKHGASFRSKSRIPTLTYLHFNGGSISRASQPLVGIQNKRSPQDERLVSAIFSSHSPPQQSPEDSPHLRPTKTSYEPDASGDVPGLSISQSDTALNEKSEDQMSTPRQRIYGSTRRNMIVDARPRVNTLANRAAGGGIEDVSNYTGATGTAIERIFLDIPNIHSMRKSLDKVIESFANSDYLDMRPNQDLLRNSGWLKYVAALVDGAELVAKAIGLGGSHVLLHCSDGWDRTAQVAGLAQVMLDPHYRTLDGFITLVQKDFVSFGHKFNHRHGIQGSEKWFEIENEKVAPSRSKENGTSESPGLNPFGSKAFSGAKNWFEKSRSTLFRQHESKTSNDESGSRPASPPPNPILHSPPTTNTAEDRKHKTDLDEIAPIFHQFLDGVFQLQCQSPEAFQFNERFLRRLFYHAHSGQYGEFLFNTEKDRSENDGKYSSAWPHFLSRRQEFTNSDYIAKVDDPLLFPRRQANNKGLEIRWWSGLFARKDEEMNTPRTLAPPDPELSESSSSRKVLESSETAAKPSGSFENSCGHAADPDAANDNLFNGTRSTSSYDTMENSVSAQFSSINMGSGEQLGAQPLAREASVRSQETGTGTEMEGDPLGASKGSKVSAMTGSKLDLAAFARESAYSDR